MKNPPHPGLSIRENCLRPLGLNVSQAARRLGVARHTLSRVLHGHAAVSPEMALRLEKAGWSNAEFWLRRQTSYDLAQARRTEDQLDANRDADRRSDSLPSEQVQDWLCELQSSNGAAPLARNTANTALPPRVRQGICKFLECLLESDPKIPPVSRIILYGSCARGDAHDESDVDIAVVFRGEVPDDNERLSLLHAMGDARDECVSRILADVVPMAVWERELSRPAERPRPEFFQNIISEGIEITPEL